MRSDRKGFGVLSGQEFRFNGRKRQISMNEFNYPTEVNAPQLSPPMNHPLWMKMPVVLSGKWKNGRDLR